MATGPLSCDICLEGYSTFEFAGLNMKPCFSNKLILSYFTECNDPDDIYNLREDLLKCSVTATSPSTYTVTGPIACKHGYVDPDTNTCVSNCGIGRYGEAIYNYRGIVETTICKNCDPSCYECTEFSKCKSCKKGFYLDTNSRTVTTGTCVAKSSGTTTATIYVTPSSNPNPNGF